MKGIAVNMIADSERLCERSKIKLLVLDVDGTLTDGKIYIGSTGEVFKVFNIKDGCGIYDILPKYGIEVAVITGRQSAIVERRCGELNIRYLFQGVRDKEKKLHELCENFGFHRNERGEYDEVAYMGDDLLDLPAMKISAFKACPKDASREVRKAANYISYFNGGNGAVRQFIEYLCEGRHEFNKIKNIYST